ncbi:hypothetical protein MNBD_GAMMA03-139 [hydrothermal vent metagenome]|uniref:Uncharacterized protein n=1 Tax=hydrothermal vent metagenome TaxID=652676 RepID=A0A3B0WF34_9ZZZZ
MSTETAAADDKHKLKQMIVAFYAIANDKPPAGLEINERVAGVFSTMLDEARKCTNSVAYVPIPFGSKPTSGTGVVIWMAKEVWGMAFDSFSEELNSACVKGVLRNWNTKMKMATLNI